MSKIILHIPELGTRLVLKKPWTFPLYYEFRNERLFESKLGMRVCCPCSGDRSTPVFGLEPLDRISNYGTSIYDHSDPRSCEFAKEQESGQHNLRLVETASGGLTPCIDVTFPKHTVLTVAGMSIRKSVLYLRKDARDFSTIAFSIKEPESAPPIRFWVRLKDANGMQVAEVGEKKPRFARSLIAVG